MNDRGPRLVSGNLGEAVSMFWEVIAIVVSVGIVVLKFWSICKHDDT